MKEPSPENILCDEFNQLVERSMRSLDSMSSRDRFNALRLIEDDLLAFAQPFDHVRSRQEKRGRDDWERHENVFLNTFLSCRAQNVHRYFERVARIASLPAIADEHRPAELVFLDGDSHRGGERPVCIHTGNRRYVVKRTDPRPYEIFTKTLDVVEASASIGLRYPPLQIDDDAHEWQVLPFLEPRTSSDPADQRLYMTRLGAVTAIAYFLDLTDIHLENLIAHDGIPVIVDMECMFSGFSSAARTPKARLMSTGLVAPQSGISSISGGNVTSREIGGHLRSDGRFAYLRPKRTTLHRLKIDDDTYSDPRDYADEIVRGFEDALRILAAKRATLADMLCDERYRTTTTRYVYRPTAHYKCYLELLFAPADISRQQMQHALLTDLFKLPTYDDDDNIDTRSGETYDLLNGDIPYFSLAAEEPYVLHQTGRVSSANPRFSLSHRIERALTEFDPADFAPLADSVRQFVMTGRIHP
jgi:lantibiotic modifying enzyme